MKTNSIVVALIFVILVAVVPAVNPAFSGIFAGLTEPATNFMNGIGSLSDQLIDAGLKVLFAGVVSAPLVMNLVAVLKRFPVLNNLPVNSIALVVAFVLNAVLLTVQGVWPGLDIANLQNIALAAMTVLVGTGGTQVAASGIHNLLVDTTYPLAYDRKARAAQ